MVCDEVEELVGRSCPGETSAIDSATVIALDAMLADGGWEG